MVTSMGWSGRGYSRGRGGMWGYQAPMPQIPPPPSGSIRIVAPVDFSNGLNSPISMRTGRAPYIAVVDVSGGKIVNVNIVQNAAAMAPRGAGVQLGQWILNIGASIVIAVSLGPNIDMVLRQVGVRVELVPPGTILGDALAKLGFVK
ncbi:MAG: hypothetical protein DRJ44_07675 [Thermoprotei archaeon]|nr:MAG: hypothetical protein DRJ44_07675 [Thermoprotei archaeon]